MKFRIIATLVLLAILGLVYAVVESNQPQQDPQNQSNDGLVLH